MRDRPTDITEAMPASALRDGWRIEAQEIAALAAGLRAPHTEGGDAVEALAELHGYLDV
jgi:hypothetical protein